jgi:phage protein U
MMMSLGTFVFSLPTLAYQELQRRTAWRHAQSSRVGARQSSQFVGPGEDSISLSGTLAAAVIGSPASLDELRTMGDQGEAWPLVDGTGKVYGAFVIQGVDERQRELFGDGTPRLIDFGVELLCVDEVQARDSQADQWPELTEI